MNPIRWMPRTWLLVCLVVLAGPSARADLVFNVSLNTSLLAADYTGPFGLDFELIGSSGNTVTLSDFNFGSGGPGTPGSASLTGGASGDLGGTVVLSDSTINFFNDFNQGFTPGGTLTFTVDSTLVAPPGGGFPDNFSMAIFSQYVSFDPSNPPAMPYDSPISTTDPTAANTFFNFNINGPGTTTVNSYPSAAGDIPITITGAVPEPPGGVMMILGVMGMIGVILRKRRATLRLQS
jgi:hypothetical protein